MRFLFLTQYFKPEIGAAPIRLHAMLKELVRAGHSVEVVTAMPSYPFGKIFPEYAERFYLYEEIDNIPVHRVWIYAATGAGIKRLLNFFSFVVTAFWGIRKAQKPDYIFVESPPLFLGITGYLVARFWKVPFIFNVSDLWPDSAHALGLIQKGYLLTLTEHLESWLYRKAAYINTLARGICEILHQEKKVLPDKILFLPNGIDINVFCPAEPDKRWQKQMRLPNKPFILYAGTHGYAHGMQVILQTAQLLSNTEVLFLLVGGGSEKPHIQHLCTYLGLKNVLFWSPQSTETIARLYNLSVAGLSTFRNSPLLEQTLPAKILPPMACGKPVLYSGAGEGAKLITEAKAGIVVPPQDPLALAEAVRRLLNDPDYAAQLGKNGRTYIETHFQWPILVDGWLQQLQGHQKRAWENHSSSETCE